MNPPIVTIGTMKTVKTFFFTFPALNSTAMNKKLKHSNSYPIINDFHNLSDLFTLIDQRTAQGWECNPVVKMCEVYNEKLNDLILPHG